MKLPASLNSPHSWLCLPCRCTANQHIPLSARRTSPGSNGSALPSCSPSETPARSTSVAGKEHLAQIGETEFKPKAGMGSPLSLKHMRLASCSFVVAKPWAHPRNCGSPESVEIIVRCPVLSKQLVKGSVGVFIACGSVTLLMCSIQISESDWFCLFYKSEYTQFGRIVFYNYCPRLFWSGYSLILLTGKVILK